MRYRLVALDVDGTLLNDRYELTPATKDTVKKVSDAGVEVVFCTGRSPVSVFPLLQELDMQGTIITHNGAATVDSATRKVIHLYPIPTEELFPFIAYCRAHGVHFDVNSAFGMYTESKNEEALEMYERFWASPIRVEDVTAIREPLVKMSLFASPEVLDKLEQVWGQMKTPLRVIRSGETFIDIIHSLATKGNALRHYAGQKGIPKDQILAIGNYYNDVDMLRYAGLGVAMGNSPREVREAADAVTLSNNENGVHHALKKFVLSEISSEKDSGGGT